jgi:hypothetical protein
MFLSEKLCPPLGPRVPLEGRCRPLGIGPELLALEKVSDVPAGRRPLWLCPWSSRQTRARRRWHPCPGPEGQRYH